MIFFVQPFLLLHWQYARWGRNAALKELSEEFETRSSPGDHAQNHKEQSDNLCHCEQDSECGAFGHQRTVQSQKQTGTIGNWGEQAGLGEHLLQKGAKSGEEAEAQDEEEAAKGVEQGKLSGFQY